MGGEGVEQAAKKKSDIEAYWPRGVRSTDRGHRSHGGVGGGYPPKKDANVSTARLKPDGSARSARFTYTVINLNLSLDDSWTHICKRVNVKISFSAWQAHNIHSVPYQSHSFLTVPISSGSLSYHSPAATSSFLSNPTTAIASVSSNENTPPTPNKVLCSCCGIYINHGTNNCTTYRLHRHQQGQKCKVGFTSAYTTPLWYAIFHIICCRSNSFENWHCWVNYNPGHSRRPLSNIFLIHTSPHLHAPAPPLNGGWGHHFKRIPMPSTVQNLVSSRIINLFLSITTTPQFVSIPSNAPECHTSAQLCARHA